MITFAWILPLVLGGAYFTQTVVALNLPLTAKVLLTIASSFLVLSMWLNLLLLPPRPKDIPKWKSVFMLVQYIFTPVISIVFGSLPGIDAQTRLMFGKYMGFWVTPKARKRQCCQYGHTNSDQGNRMNAHLEFYLGLTGLFVGTFLFAMACTVAVRRFARYVGAMDIPKDARKIHKKPMPLLGGWAVIATFTIVSILYILVFRAKPANRPSPFLWWNTYRFANSGDNWILR